MKPPTDPTFRSVAIESRAEARISKLRHTVRFIERIGTSREGYFNKLLEVNRGNYSRN
jgi:hypothetical protein